MEPDNLHKASTVTAFTYHAFANAMQASELKSLEPVVTSGLLQSRQPLLEANELSAKDVGLINLICNAYQALLCGKL